MKNALITALCILVFSSISTGCLWVMAGAVGVAVVSANLDEYEHSKTNSTGVEALNEHLADQKAVDDALAGVESEKIEVKENVTVDDVLIKYEGEIRTD
ncbi:hypothetical protein SAMN05660337_0793 [Maridesulfovibrio ferrireducens]|uniref:Lipoprotein n=1 Tax=Maridesulfovibrio ferrireducens TaxID=246191 RepID=A0A1G9CTU1_9BACT|nr:hypothetical protein [Maridesulfovibrio ferrireducens]SDK55110.1 hypothetical protein SAMN05660337_0793 [Maridesulfovibrio ferrireducens]